MSDADADVLTPPKALARASERLRKGLSADSDEDPRVLKRRRRERGEPEPEKPRKLVRRARKSDRDALLVCPDIVAAMENRTVFGRYFGGDSWRRWKIFLKALTGLPLAPSEVDDWTLFTERKRPPTGPFREALALVGRRGGKSEIAALLAVWRCTSRSWSDDDLGPGGIGTFPIIASDRKQARTILRYVKGLLDSCPALRGEYKALKESVVLNNRTVIEIHTASFKNVRGYTVIGAACDELAFWQDDTGANPATEILNALRPAMGTVPDAVLLSITTVYARRGEAWRLYRNNHGSDDARVLTWLGSTPLMNPKFDVSVIEAASEQDPAYAQAEYFSIWRADLESFVSEEQIKAVAVGSEREPRAGVKYYAFVDPAGGGGQDSMTCAVAHREGDVAVLDMVREWRPTFDPKDVTAAIAAELKKYGVSEVVGDKFAGDWPLAEFRASGVRYKPSEKTKSEIYLAALPAITGKRCELINTPRLLAQLRGLERRTARGGRDTVDHAANQHDDLINAALGAILLCAKPESGVVVASVTRATDGSYREGGHAAQSPGQSAPPWSYGDQGAIHPHSRIERAGPAQPPSRWRNIWGA